MAIRLPPPANPTEEAADALLRELDSVQPLIPGRNWPFYIRDAYKIYNRDNVPTQAMRCAGLRLVKFLPIVGLSHQWSTLVCFTCPPKWPIGSNTQFLSFYFFDVLKALHQVATERTPQTLELFQAEARVIMAPISNPGSLPNPPLTIESIDTPRRGYKTLENHYYAP